jgi:predicted transposase YbfD/YdcC
MHFLLDGVSMPRMSCALLEQLLTLPDPRRVTRNRKHLLVDILLSAFCGVLADCNNFVEIAEWARHHEDFLLTFLELPNGIPAHDTYGRVLTAVRPEALQGILIPWLQQRRGLPGDWVHLDGKSLRGTRRTSHGLGALHLVSAWAGQHGLTLGQVAVDAKSNEITAIPQLLELLDLRDKVVTIDAAGCQKDIAAQIVEAGGDYVLAVKDNQPTLHAEVRAAFQTALEADSPDLRRCIREERGHGRQERRVVWVLPATPYVTCQAAWLGLRSLVLVLRVVTCPVSGVETEEVRYFISSLRPRVRRLARVIRGHWSIENGLHWVLDVVFREDARRLYDRTAAENVGLLNRLATSLLRGDPSKGSLTVKRKRAAWSVGYLSQLLGLPSP